MASDSSNRNVESLIRNNDAKRVLFYQLKEHGTQPFPLIDINKWHNLDKFQNPL